MLIGELTGEVSTNRLTFEAYKDVEQFDFVTVKNPKDGQEWILAQVDEVTKHPDGKTVCEANVIGFRENGLLKQPRYVLDPDSMVYQADEGVIADTLGLTTDGLYMGRLETNPDIRIFMDPEELYKHIAVLAKTGAGKSYATGVMIEELLEQDYPVVIIDPHGEFNTLQRANPEADDAARGYDMTEYSTNTVVNPDAEELSFSSKNLSAKEIEQLVPTNLTNAQLEVLYNALNDLKKREEYDLDDIVDTCMSQQSKAKWNLVNILEVVQDSNMFADNPTPLNELVTPGDASILNLKGVDPEQQEMVVYMLAKELFQQRKIGELQPFIMVIEEAHNFVPERNFGKAVCSDILRTIASEGRKFGMGLGVVSQRPARVDKNILSQCNTQLILRVTNPNDLNAIARSFEGVTSEVKNYLTALPPGTGLLLGNEYPVMTDIRTRRSQHGGAMKELSQDTAEPTKTEPAAPEPVTTSDPAPSPDPAPTTTEPAPDTTPDNTSETAPPRHAVQPVLDRDALANRLGPVQTAYYPLWVARSGSEQIAIDGTDGAVKARKIGIDTVTENVLGILQQEDCTAGELVERLNRQLQDVQNALDDLIRQNLVEQDGDQYRATGAALFAADQEPFTDDATTIAPDVTKEQAAETAAQYLSTPPDTVEQVYYPYFTAGDRVFDAVLCEEV